MRHSVSNGLDNTWHKQYVSSTSTYTLHCKTTRMVGANLELGTVGVCRINGFYHGLNIT